MEMNERKIEKVAENEIKYEIESLLPREKKLYAHIIYTTQKVRRKKKRRRIVHSKMLCGALISHSSG